MSNWTFAFFLALLFTCTACSTDVVQPGVVSEFFDLTQFIADYTQDSQLVTVTKSVEINGASETKTIKNYPFYLDALSFENHDINRSALFDKYKVDTSRQKDEVVVTHRALDPLLKVQSLQVKKQGNQVKEITIQTKAKSLLADIELEIIFTPDRGYSLLRRSKKIFKDSTHTLIEVEINN